MRNLTLSNQKIQAFVRQDHHKDSNFFFSYFLLHARCVDDMIGRYSVTALHTATSIAITMGKFRAKNAVYFAELR